MKTSHFFAFSLCLPFASGCAPSSAPAAAAPAPVTPATPPSNGASLLTGPADDPAALRACPPDSAMISDNERSPNRSNALEERGGYWYTYTDKLGTSITPTAGDQGGTFAMSDGGANGTQRAARMVGKTAEDGDVFAGMGLNFVDPKGEYDARKYKGISFWAKKGSAESTPNVRLKLPDRNTDPGSGVCTQCYNDFGQYLQLTQEWKKFEFSFASMSQMSDWGKPRPPHITVEALYGVQFQVDDRNKPFDIWVDEIQFTGCP